MALQWALGKQSLLRRMSLGHCLWKSTGKSETKTSFSLLKIREEIF
jgi:hypothetical protein